jgi:hypothetical protein
MTAKIGYAEGKCSRCGKTLRRKRPADYAICNCYLCCPLCGEEMVPYMPDLTLTIYESEKGLEVFHVCSNHAPVYYSKQKPVEVKLF